MFDRKQLYISLFVLGLIELAAVVAHAPGNSFRGDAASQRRHLPTDPFQPLPLAHPPYF